MGGEMNLSYVKKIFLVIFLDLLAYSAIMPLLPILFLDSQFFLKIMQTAQKVILLGGLYAIYPLFQALCSPFWIKKADLLGRKRMLQISFLGNFIGYSISCCGVMTGFFGYFLIGNAIAGALGVNLSTMNALISDSTQGTRRVKYFGLVNLILGLAFALGPLLSSHLVPKVPHVETIALVLFIFAAFLALINLALVSSIKPPLFINEKDSVTSINLKLLKKEAFYPLCLIFLTTFGWYIFIKTFQIFLLKCFRN
jgi:MFS family permease